MSAGFLLDPKIPKILSRSPFFFSASGLAGTGVPGSPGATGLAPALGGISEAGQGSGQVWLARADLLEPGLPVFRGENLRLREGGNGVRGSIEEVLAATAGGRSM